MLEKKILICGNANPADLDKQIDGSIISKCTQCLCDIFVAPTGQKLLEKDEATPLCLRCALMSVLLHKQENPDEELSFGLAPGAVQEILGSLRRDTA